ncbi:MAG: amidohydrolase [candidate division Zixibacteria bacterium]
MNAILYNAQIYPQYRVSRRPTVLVITGKVISEIGYDVSRIKRNYPRHKKINVRGRAIIPGMVDSHTHFYFWAKTFHSVHLDGIRSYNEALGKIRSYASKTPPGEWIIGDGWSADRWDEYYLPTAKELDAVTGNHPAGLFSKDQHTIWVNSRALRMAGIDKNYPDPPGGKIDRDSATNEPLGILRETPAYFPVYKLMNRAIPEQILRSWKAASKIAYSRGVTGFHSMDGPEGYDYFEQLNNQNKLSFRIHYYFPVKMLDELIEQGIHSEMGDDKLRIGGVKIFVDGALGSQTALMKKPYLGSKNNIGLEVTKFGDLKKQVRKAARNNLACAVHAIGDRAVSNVISAFELVSNRNLRHRIEHLQLISKGDIGRLKRIGAIASMQPSHCPSDRQLVAEYWGIRGQGAYIFKTLLNQNIPLAFGSDCPIEPLDPLAGISAAVNRTGCGERGGSFYAEESISVSNAVHGFTAGPAYASGRESFSGKIAPGYQADLVILEDNIFTMPKSKIYQALVAATIFDGKIVYQNSCLKIF